MELHGSALASLVCRVRPSGAESWPNIPFCTLQGVDWRDPRAQGCNAGRNPIQESFYDGVNADPLEVLFVKVKASMHQAHWQHVLQVTIYDHLSWNNHVIVDVKYVEGP